MKTNINRGRLAAIAFTGFTTINAQAVIQLAVNGGFETGDTTGWQYFPTGSSTFSAISPGSASSFAGELSNTTIASGTVIKQNEVGAGLLTTGQSITISFDFKELSAAGGVLQVELFSINGSGGVSNSLNLNGGPLFGSSSFESRSYTTNLVGDVSGGVTLQFVAATGGAPGSSATGTFDNVSITVIPEPSAAALAGLGGLALLRRRRTPN